MKTHERVVAFLSEKCPGVHVDVNVLSSGSVWIDVVLGDGLLTIECTTAGEVGISRVLDPKDGFGGHDEAFGNVEAAIVWLDKLLQSSR